MKIGGNDRFFGPFTRIGHSVQHKLPIKREIRAEFLNLPFSDQAKLIGWHAKNQLKIADKVITKSLWSPSGEMPKAADFWANIFGKAAVFDQCELNEKSSVASISWPSSEMEQIVNNLSRVFTETYAYWVHEFYSCGLNGDGTFADRQASLPRTFKDKEMRMIDDMSGLPDLGSNMKKFADMLFHMEVLRDKNN